MACCSKLTNLLRRIGAACCGGKRRVKVLPCPELTLGISILNPGDAVFTFSGPITFVSGTVLGYLTTDCTGSPAAVSGSWVAAGNVLTFTPAPGPVFVSYQYTFTVTPVGKPGCPLTSTVCLNNQN
jgi:hypothetical protein